MPATAMAVTALTGRRSRVRIDLVVGAGVHILGCGALLFLGAGSPLWLLALLAGVVGVLQGLIGLHDLAGLLLGAAAFLLVCAADRPLGRVGTGPRRRP
ncbi:hypothetical protein ACFUIT_35780 [Streptomyces sp. NPDC057239]|uniref:hypothetical protein n=1 Tax=Streptomyces sp. NPDC057239 TaxID=3346061 RepID=UPI00362BD510